jgi:hypothetical protein
VKLYDLKNVSCLGTITGPGRSEEYAKVAVPLQGEIEVPRHHVIAIRPAGRGNKVVVIRGDDLGKLGIVDSTAVKYKGKWVVKEHLTDKIFIVSRTDLANIERFPTVH